MSRWFRMYDDLLDDPKVQRLDPVLFKTWVNLLCLASKNDGKLQQVPDIAFALRLDDSTACLRLEELKGKGLIDAHLVDGYQIHNWDKRQYKSDRDATAAERQQRKRDKEKDHASVTRDVTEQSQSPDTEQSRTDKVMSETSSDNGHREKKKRGKADYPDDFKTFYADYPADPGMSKPEALKAWLKLPDDDRDKATKAIPAFKAWVAKQGTDYRTVHACRYLSQRRFEGFDATDAKTIFQKIAVVKGSAAWIAWQAHKGKSLPETDLRGADGIIIGRGWYFDTQFPPNHEVRAA